MDSDTPKSNLKEKINIRPAGPADAVLFVELRQEALRDNPSVFGSNFETGENCTIEWALMVLAPNPSESCNFVAEIDQKLIGMAGIRRYQGSKVRHSAMIGGVYVRPAWRGQRLAMALIEACHNWAKKNELVSLKLAVVTTNLAALQVYKRLGFQIYGTEPKVILHAGVYYDEYLLARDV